MGTVISKAASEIGGILAAPFKSIFGGSCEDVCSGPWDMICFIEHLCVVNLVKFLMILGLCYITLMFFYLLFKLGLCQCIVRSLCKICWAACETYWFALEDMTCFLWHKLRNTKRVHRRRRFRDIEKGYTLSSESDSDDDRDLSVRRKRKSRREGRKARLQNSFHPSRKNGSGSQHHHHQHLRLKTSEVSVHVKRGSKGQRKSRRVQLAHARRNPRKGPKIFKKQRIR